MTWENTYDIFLREISCIKNYMYIINSIMQILLPIKYYLFAEKMLEEKYKNTVVISESWD